MAIEQPAFTISLVAGADLSTNAQFRFVKQDASGQAILCAAVTDKPIGVLQNNPGSGGEANVMVEGVSKIEAGAALAIDDLIATDASGRGAPAVPGTDTTKYIVGRMLGGVGTASGAGGAASAAGELGHMLFSCISVGGNRGA